jgi:hypothetical protein
MSLRLFFGLGLACCFANFALAKSPNQISSQDKMARSTSKENGAKKNPRQQLKQAIESTTTPITPPQRTSGKFAYINRLTGQSTIFNLLVGDKYELEEEGFKIKLKDCKIIDDDLSLKYKANVEMLKVASDKDYPYDGDVDSEEAWKNGPQNSLFALNLISCNEPNPNT